MSYNTQTCCRACYGGLEVVFDLGMIAPSNFVECPTSITGTEVAPLVLVKCTNCNLVQLQHTLDLDQMYRQYWYKSDLNAGMVNALRDVVTEILKYTNLIEGEYCQKGDVVLDIGCNVGTMLSFFPEDVLKVGFDPALNLCAEAEKNCDIFVNDYFTAEKYPLDQKAQIVTSIAMFYDLPDPNQFVEDVKSVMNHDGLWVIQLTDLLPMLQLNEFTNVVFEHLEYYSLQWLVDFLKKHDLEVFNITRSNVNGGSVRLFVSRPHVQEVRSSVQKYLDEEASYMNSFLHPFDAFSMRVESAKRKVISFLREQREEGKVVMGLGASTKGNTLLQYFGIDNKLISFIGDVNSAKYGLYTVGSNILVIPERDVLDAKPDVLFVNIWQHRESISKKLELFLIAGGKLLFPLPEPVLMHQGGASFLH